MASNYSVLTHEQLKAQLDDTQASLAAALARIEGMRIKEKQLVAELSALRKQVHGQNAGSSPAAEGKGPRSYPVQSGSNDPSRNGSSAALANLGSAEPSSSRSPASTWEGDAKKYVSNCDGEHPVCIVNGSKKVSSGDCILMLQLSALPLVNPAVPADLVCA